MKEESVGLSFRWDAPPERGRRVGGSDSSTEVGAPGVYGVVEARRTKSVFGCLDRHDNVPPSAKELTSLLELERSLMYRSLISSQLALLLAVFSLTAAPSVAATITTASQDFNSDPAPDGWLGLGNTSGGNNYGWSSGTNNTNSDAVNGEAGGTFARQTANSNSYFADVSFSTSLTLNDAIRASGEFVFTSVDGGTVDPFLLIGFFDRASADINSDANWLGMSLADSAGTNLRVQSIIRLSNNTSPAGDSNVSGGPFSSNVSRFFDINYDPTIGNGRLTMTIDDDDDLGNGFLGQNVRNLSLGQRNTGATFTAFGIVNGEGGNQGPYQVFIDDVTYTKAVPEPGSAVLLGMGALVVGLVCRREALGR